MPTPEEKEQARPVRRALKKAIGKVDSPRQADRIIDQLEAETAGETSADAEEARLVPESLAAGAEAVRRAAQSVPEREKTGRVLEMTARAASTGDKRQREALAQAAQEVLNPEQQGAAGTAADQQEREYLRQAVLRRLKPLDAVDANLFLAINHLPHTRFLNAFFYTLTMLYNGAAVWHILMALAAFRHRGRAAQTVREMSLPLAITTALVEFPVKPYFRRRRPFIAIIQAIVIGKKPGTWSFPSGHAAGAFAGAWLLNRGFPKWSPASYTIAALVAFSRIYLGDHYPGDVLSGSLFGLLFARILRRLLGYRQKR